MIDNYKSLIKEFKHYTELAIDSAQNEDYVKLNMYINERQNVIIKINELHCSKEDLRAEFINNKIGEFQAKLVLLINGKKDSIKNEAAKALNAANVSKNYYSGIEKKAIIFSKKV